MIPFKNNNIQINGLYKVSAEIIDVDLVADHNCLLWYYNFRIIIQINFYRLVAWWWLSFLFDVYSFSKL